MTFANCPLTSTHPPIPFPTTNKQILFFFLRMRAVRPCDPALKPTKASKIHGVFTAIEALRHIHTGVIHNI